MSRFMEKLTASANHGAKKARAVAAYSTSKAFVIWYSQKMAARFGEYAAFKRFKTSDEMAQLLAFCASDRAAVAVILGDLRAERTHLDN